MSILPRNFNYKDYLQLNPDLYQNATYQEAAQHYINHGYRENRQYSFNPELIPTTNTYSNTNILIVVVSCYKHRHLWDNIKYRTNNDLIIITGTNNNNKWYDKNNKVLYLNCNDYYDGLPEKIILMIEEVLRNPEFSHITHILKIDDHDTYFDDNIIKNIYNYNELLTYDYIGQKLNCWSDNILGNYHFGKVPSNSYWNNRLNDISNVIYFDGGCSYILNRKAMQLINNVYHSSNINQLRKNEIYEDVMIGRILMKTDAKYLHLNYGIFGDK